MYAKKLLAIGAMIGVIRAQEFPAAYVDTIGQIGDNFQENLKRGFNNAGVRMQDSKKQKNIHLQDVALSVDNFYIWLRNVQLTTEPEFRVKKFQVDLKNASIEVKFHLGELTVVCDDTKVNKTIFKNMPMVSNTKTRININGMEARGRIGIFPIQDSFMPKIYHIDYLYENVEIESLSIGPSGTAAVETAFFTNQDFSPLTLLLNDLTGKLNCHLQRQLDAVIVEYSVNEMLLDEAEDIAAYKDYLRRRTLKANRLIDNLLDKAHGMSLFKDVSFPTRFTLPFKRDAPGAGCRGRLDAEGYVTGVETITRPADWSMVDNDEQVLAYGFLAIRDYKFTYDYVTEYMNSSFKGKIKATIYKNRFGVELLIHKKKTNPRGELRIDVSELNDIELEISGLGSLSWLETNIRSIVLGHIRSETRARVIDFLAKRMQKAFPELDLTEARN